MEEEEEVVVVVVVVMVEEAGCQTYSYNHRLPPV